MLARREFLGVIVGGGLAAWACRANRARAQAPDPTTGDASLKDTLTFGLKPRLPSEYKFVDDVVAKVDNKSLPVELVIGTFRWARDKKPYGFPHFQRAMKIRAAKIGVEL